MSEHTIPASIGPYRVLALLGEGGMAEVYKVERVGEGGFRKVLALKRMRRQFPSSWLPLLIERFTAEARTNARLTHPNLIQVVDYGSSPMPYLVMEYVDGLSLAHLLGRLTQKIIRMPLSATLFIVSKVASGLDYAHKKRDEEGQPLHIVHRDVSPQNILVSRLGEVMVSDFGLVRVADGRRITGAGALIGKVSYNAPEQFAGREVDHRADIFSLGVVLWECLTLRRLIPDHDLRAAAMVLQRGHFAPPSAFNVDVPPELDALTLRCLALDPAARPADAQEVARGTRTLLHQLSPGYGPEELALLLQEALPEESGA